MSDPAHADLEARFTRLVELIARLRAPGGCPWDREQTHESLKSTIIEEAYEVVEAIDDGDDAELIGELGDLLLQVVFHSQIATEADRFTIGDVVDKVTAKMRRRHPHVFGEASADSSGEVLRSWETIKAQELAEKSGAAQEQASLLDSVSARLPGVMEAFQMTTKASRLGFDWPDTASVLEKLHEEIAEYRDVAAREDAAHHELSEEVGDMLFVAVNLARHHGVDPESALKATNRKFRRRFRYIEQRLRERGRGPFDTTLEEMDALWDEAKDQERRGRD
jgi:MazG family protein